MSDKNLPYEEYLDNEIKKDELEHPKKNWFIAFLEWFSNLDWYLYLILALSFFFIFYTIFFYIFLFN